MSIESSQTLICIVDDDISFREALEGLVRSLGFAVSAFDSPEAFLKADIRREIFCLILDVRMPDMTGLELQARLLASGAAPPMLFVSSADDGPDRVRALEAGAIGFLGKPFDRQAMCGFFSTLQGAACATHNQSKVEFRPD